MIAVESDGQGVDLNRVAGFMQKVSSLPHSFVLPCAERLLGARRWSLTHSRLASTRHYLSSIDEPLMYMSLSWNRDVNQNNHFYSCTV